jgi:hypothetical protein
MLAADGLIAAVSASGSLESMKLAWAGRAAAEALDACA